MHPRSATLYINLDLFIQTGDHAIILSFTMGGGYNWYILVLHFLPRANNSKKVKDLNLVRFFWRFLEFLRFYSRFFKIFFMICLRFLGFLRLFFRFFEIVGIYFEIFKILVRGYMYHQEFMLKRDKRLELTSIFRNIFEHIMKNGCLQWIPRTQIF